jgi:hypothetical protein
MGTGGIVTAVVYTKQSVKAMDGGRFGRLLESLSRAELETMICFLSGWSPEGTAAALNSVERIRAMIAAPAPEVAS